MGFKVYISSVYTEFKDARESIHKYVTDRGELYDLVGMENYVPEDRKALSRCIEDVNDADIYVCLLGYTYGTESLEPTADHKRISFTHWEFNTAQEKKAAGKKIERLIFIKETPTGTDNDPRLTQWKAAIKGPQNIMSIPFKNDDDLPKLVMKALDKYIERIKSDSRSQNLIYNCNRNVPNLTFDAYFTDAPVQFYLVTSHDRDLPHYFVRRKRLELETNNKVLQLDLQTNRIIEETTDFSILQKLMNAAIFSKLPPGHTFRNPDDVSIPALLAMMRKMDKNYLIITWNIQSIYWKNDTFCNHIASFYDSYKEYNSQIKSDQKIIFIGICKYLDNSKITEEEFDNRIRNITYGTHLPKLTKITLDEVKDWLIDNWIEPNTDNANALIRKNITDVTRSEYYYSELEGALKTMIDQYNNKN
jgi:hypothetical protein